MKVLISWSGQPSCDVALALKRWLPCVIQQVEPYVSSEDIRKGNRWGVDIARELETTDHGIVCLTRSNLDAPWIHFETGALSKSIDTSAVWTLLVGDISPSDIVGPLAQFQHTAVEQEDFWRLLLAINQSLGSSQLNESTLRQVYDKFWPDLKTSITTATCNVSEDSDMVRRSPDAILSEVLDLSRSMSRSLADHLSPEDAASGPIYNYITSLAIAPTQDEGLIDQLRMNVNANARMQAYGITGHSAGGIGVADDKTEYNNVGFQAYNPLPKELLFTIARDVGLTPIDVAYRRFVYGRRDQSADSDS